jgi:hypothetical protein
MKLTLGRTKQLRINGCNCGCASCGGHTVNGNIISDALDQVLPTNAKGVRTFTTTIEIQPQSIIVLAGSILAAGVLIKHL